MSEHCKFDPTHGIKTYAHEEACEFAFNAQHKAYVLGYAPPVIRKIDEFSYQTEIAETKVIMDILKPDIYYNMLFPDMHNALKEIFKDLPKKKLAGPDGVDMARHNLGIYKGRVVMIDFY